MMLGLLLALSLLPFAGGFRIVCFYTNMAQYRPVGGKFLPEDIPPGQCTHIVYAYATPLGFGLMATDDNDETTPNKKGMYQRVLQLKEQNKDMKVLLALAGPDTTAEPFRPILDTPVTRSLFVQTLIAFLRRNRFDGVVISWKYPFVHDAFTLDRAKFVLFFKELRESINVDGSMRQKPSLIISAVFPGIEDDILSGYDIGAITDYTDFISMVTIDYHYKMNSTVTLSSPSYSSVNDTLSLEASMRFLEKKKIPKEKVNIGINLAGRSFTLDKAMGDTTGSKTTGPGPAGLYTRTKGMLAYYEVCQLFKSGAKAPEQTSQDVPTLVKGNLWVLYEDTRSVIAKACYVIDNEFGGVMVQSLDLDDFAGEFCGQGKYPLIDAIKSIFRDKSCRNYGPVKHAVGGQSQVMNNSTGWRCLFAGLVLLGLSFNYNPF